MMTVHERNRSNIDATKLCLNSKKCHEQTELHVKAYQKMQGFDGGKLQGREQGKLSEHLQLSGSTHDMGDVMTQK